MSDTASRTARARQRRTFGLMEVDGNLIGVDIANLIEAAPIEDLAPLMVTHPALLGAIRLRGRMIPVFDPRALSGGPRSETTHKIAAILGKGDRIVGLAIDAISGLAKLDVSALQRLKAEDEPDGSLFLGWFYHDGRTVNVVDPDALIGRGGLPTAEQIRREDGTGEQAQGHSQTYLTFRAGGASFAAPAIEVHRTLPRRPIDRNALTGGHCLGSVTLSGVRVPVLDAIGVLGLGGVRENEHPEIVVIGFPGDRLVGLAVDVICQIAAFDSRALRPVPGILGGGKTTIRSVVTDREDRQTYVLNVPFLREIPDLQTMADLSRSIRTEDRPRSVHAAAHAPGEPADAANAIIRERRRNLIFQAGRNYAVPIEKVVRILEPPARVTPLSSPIPGVVGLFSVDDQATTLVCLSRNLTGRPPQDSARRRVLLVRAGDQQIGFLVSAVDSIETSVWRGPNTEPAPYLEQIVKMERAAHPNVLPFLDIEGLAAEIGTRFQECPVLA